MRIGRKIICQLSNLWKPKFFILCGAIFLVRLQEKFDIDHSWECKGYIHCLSDSWSGTGTQVLCSTNTNHNATLARVMFQTNHAIGVSTKQSHMTGVFFPVTDEGLEQMQALKAKQISLVLLVSQQAFSHGTGKFVTRATFQDINTWPY